MIKTLPEQLTAIIELLILEIEAQFNGGPLSNRVGAPVVWLARKSLTKISNSFAAFYARLMAGQVPTPEPRATTRRNPQTEKSPAKPVRRPWLDGLRSWLSASPHPTPAARRAPRPANPPLPAAEPAALPQKSMPQTEPRLAKPPAGARKPPSTIPSPTGRPTRAATARPPRPQRHPNSVRVRTNTLKIGKIQKIRGWHATFARPFRCYIETT